MIFVLTHYYLVIILLNNGTAIIVITNPNPISSANSVVIIGSPVPKLISSSELFLHTSIGEVKDALHIASHLLYRKEYVAEAHHREHYAYYPIIDN